MNIHMTGEAQAAVARSPGRSSVMNCSLQS
jgi:hypothetical protein